MKSNSHSFMNKYAICSQFECVKNIFYLLTLIVTGMKLRLVFIHFQWGKKAFWYFQQDYLENKWYEQLRAFFSSTLSTLSYSILRVNLFQVFAILVVLFHNSVSSDHFKETVFTSSLFLFLYHNYFQLANISQYMFTGILPLRSAAYLFLY